MNYIFFALKTLIEKSVCQWRGAKKPFQGEFELEPVSKS